MFDLSIEAKVVAGTWWGVMNTSEVSFQRTHIIHPRTRKGLDELTSKGYLTADFYDGGKRGVWRPTKKMKVHNPRIPVSFVKEHGFPITDESAA